LIRLLAITARPRSGFSTRWRSGGGGTVGFKFGFGSLDAIELGLAVMVGLSEEQHKVVLNLFMAGGSSEEAV
jgi:hypothetical protein